MERARQLAPVLAELKGAEVHPKAGDHRRLERTALGHHQYRAVVLDPPNEGQDDDELDLADERGRMLQQIESGHTASELRERFALQGFLVYDVRPRSLLSGGEVSVRQRRVKLEQFVVFNSQFVTLIRAGLPIPTALELLAKQQKNAYFRGSARYSA